MTKLERLGNKCTNTICRKECPVWYFTNKGVGNGTGNNCVESLRFPNVARAVELWLSGKEWSKEELERWEEAEWQTWHDGWFTYHYCTSCGYKHFDPEEKVLPSRCPNCNLPMKGEDDDTI